MGTIYSGSRAPIKAEETEFCAGVGQGEVGQSEILDQSNLGSDPFHITSLASIAAS